MNSLPDGPFSALDDCCQPDLGWKTQKLNQIQYFLNSDSVRNVTSKWKSYYFIFEPFDVSY